MRIGTIHATLSAVGPLTEAIHEIDPSIEVCNFVNEELLYHANQVKGVDDWGARNFMRLMMQAAEASVDGIIIACSLYSAYAGQAQLLTSKPVIAIDQPMIERAVREGTRIGVLATTASAGPAEEAKLLAQAERMGKKITTRIGTDTKAMEALRAGDQEEHDRRLREAGLKLKEAGCDVLVLSQITMASGAKGLQKEGLLVLTSPQSGAEDMVARIRQKEQVRVEW